MKKIFTLLLTALSATTFSQSFVDDSVNIQATYPNQSFYSLENGEVSNVDNKNWDIAFGSTGISSTFRVNHAAGTKVWLYPHGGFDQWNSIDTAGITSWPQLANSTDSWEMGALSQPADPNDPFDLGWGAYDMATHQVLGNRVFILETKEGAYKKLFVESLASGVFTVQTADVDGANPADYTFTKADYSDNNFGYFEFSSETTLAREPISHDWDLVFSKYGEEIAMGPGMTIIYGVSGVLANVGVEAMQLYPVNDVYADQDTTAVPFSSSISAIGRAWKSINMGTGSWDIADSTVYMVKTRNEDVWQLVFTGFKSDGTFNFSKKKIYSGISSVDGITEKSSVLNVYPNPAADQLNIAFDLEKSQAVEMSLYNLQGQLVAQEVQQIGGFTSAQINVSAVPTGIYLLTIQADGVTTTHRIVKQ